MSPTVFHALSQKILLTVYKGTAQTSLGFVTTLEVSKNWDCHKWEVVFVPWGVYAWDLGARISMQQVSWEVQILCLALRECIEEQKLWSKWMNGFCNYLETKGVQKMGFAEQLWVSTILQFLHDHVCRQVLLLERVTLSTSTIMSYVSFHLSVAY